MKQRLQEKGFSPKDIDETIKRLLGWRYLDDRAYAISYIKSKEDRLSKKKIWIELLRAGIAKELATAVLEEFYSEEKENYNCIQLARKLWHEEDRKWERKYKYSFKNKNIPKEVLIKKKVGDKLLLRGFLVSTVKSVLGRISEGEDF
jgi:regulatory protein